MGQSNAMPMTSAEDALSDLWRWLTGAAEASSTVEDLFRSYCLELAGRGVPIWRGALGLEVLHPEVSGSLIIWTDDSAMAVRESERAGILHSSSYLNSPTRVVDETGTAYRRRLEGSCEDMPLLEDLRLQGSTDYLMLPLPFLDRTRTATMAFATRRAQGFTDETIDTLTQAAKLFSPYAERHVLRRIALDLLNIYVGRRTGQRVFEGRIERGSHEIMEAAIWFGDLRDFTRLSEITPADQLIALLNGWFGAMAEAIDQHDGEILKFIGDAVLAVFPVTDERSRERACSDAEAAARGFAARMKAGRKFGLALHFGEVFYGNVGARNRLDFTVIGPAVNLAARLQALTKSLVEPVVASETFARALDHSLPGLGKHRLRGIPDPQTVFAVRV
jgi:adenylate cyclase